MAEIETQPVGGNQGTGLPDVGAKDGAQGGVEQVGAAVVAGGVQTAMEVHPGRHRLAQGHIAPFHHTPVDNQPGHRALGIFHPHQPIGAGYDTLVANLPAALGIEGRVFQDYLYRLALDGMAGGYVVHQQGGHQRFLLKLAITDELGMLHAQVFVSSVHLHTAGKALSGTGLLPLRLHLPFKTVHIHV